MRAIRQEVLSGVRYTEQFARLRDYLRAFPDLELTSEDYELATESDGVTRSLKQWIGKDVTLLR